MPIDILRWCEVEERLVVAQRGAPELVVALVGAEISDEVLELLLAAGARISVHTAVGDWAATGLDGWVVLLDVRNGDSRQQLRDAADRFAPAFADHAIAVLCDHADVADVRSLLFAGVSGLVLRSELSSTLVPTVCAVGAGQICVPHRHVRSIERPVLSIREKQVVGLAAMGLTNCEIADRLFLAESTVKSHLSSSFSKLGVHSRHEAVDLLVDPAAGIGLGILSLDAEPVSMSVEASGDAESISVDLESVQVASSGALR